MQAVNAAHRQLKGLTVPWRKYSHKSSFHFFFSILRIDGKRSIDLESVESYPAMCHHSFEPISALEQCIQEHIPHYWCVGSTCNKMVVHRSNHNHGIQMSWTMLPDLTTAYSSYGMAAQVVLAHCAILIQCSRVVLEGGVLHPCTLPGSPDHVHRSFWLHVPPMHLGVQDPRYGLLHLHLPWRLTSSLLGIQSPHSMSTPIGCLEHWFHWTPVGYGHEDSLKT